MVDIQELNGLGPSAVQTSVPKRTFVLKCHIWPAQIRGRTEKTTCWSNFLLFKWFLLQLLPRHNARPSLAHLISLHQNYFNGWTVSQFQKNTWKSDMDVKPFSLNMVGASSSLSSAIVENKAFPPSALLISPYLNSDQELESELSGDLWGQQGYSFQTASALWSRWTTTCRTEHLPETESHYTSLRSSPPLSGSAHN